MKRLVAFLVVMISAVTLLAGCSQMQTKQTSSEPDSSQVESIPFADKQLYAAAYLGYKEIDDLSFYIQNYLDHDDIPIHYVSQGEYYLVVPRYSGMHVSLYENDIQTMDSSLIYEDKACSPFIIQCNISDIFPDVTVRFTYGDETVEFSPYISLEDGAAEVGERGFNLTKQPT